MTAATRRPLPPKRLYLDSSALVKLVVPEQETSALRRLLRLWPRRSTSALAAVEVPRAARRHSNDAPVARRAEEVLAQIGQIAISREILSRAAELEPATLRALDAIHLVSALTLGRDLGALVTYDVDLEKAARSLGIDVLAPS
jgi:uncharacterized protein